jgi:hypothetical protein
MINMTYFSPKRIKKGSIQIVRLYQTYAFNMVHEMRIELTREIPYAPQTYASTSSAIRASLRLYNNA